MQNIVMVDTGGANIASIKYAFERIDIELAVSKNKKIIEAADKVILPGVGNAKYIMENIKNSNLVECIADLKQPVLGICIGMQILFSSTEEGPCDCLDIIKGDVKKFDIPKEYSVPHMGWNTLSIDKNDLIFKCIENESFVYFVHSYYGPVVEETLATSKYPNKFSAVVKKDNFYGFQFHPEKSGEVGLQLIKNFVELI